MREGYSGIKFLFDATEGSSRHLHVGLEIEGPFTGNSLVLSFPRWVPGSYFIREPIQYMFDFEAHDNNGKILPSKRKNVNSMKININDSTNLVKVKYKILARELSCRSTHIDNSHIHVMPPFTWFLPVSGVEVERIDKTHIIEAHIPSHWTPATQYLQVSKESSKGQLTNNAGDTYRFEAPNRDELLDGILEANHNETISWEIENIDGFGIMKIKFNESINWNYSKRFLNQTFLDIFIDPLIGEYDEYDTPRNLNLTWRVIGFQNNILTLSLNFTKPLDISMNFVYDKLVVQIVNETEIFKSKENKGLAVF